VAVKEQLVARLTSRSAWRKLADLHVADAGRRTPADEQVVALCTAAHVLRQHAADPRGAADILERARALAPTDRDVLLALIHAYGAIGDHRRALVAVTAALEHDPEDAWLYRCRSTVHQALGDHDQALADLERAYDKSSGGYANELVAQLERALGRVSGG